MSAFTNEDQAHLSGLHILAAKNHPSEEQQEQEQPKMSYNWWNQDVNEFPNLLKQRCEYAAVVLLDGDDDDKNNNSKNDTTADHGSGGDSRNRLVLVGGQNENQQETKSVWILTSTVPPSSFFSSATAKREWRQGPSFQERRSFLAVMICGPYLYGCGGCNGQIWLDTMERILLVDLFPNSNIHKHQSTSSSSSSSSTSSSRTTLNVQLLEPRHVPCAVTVPGDRFVLVMGGYNGLHVLFCVDIVDTEMPCTTTTPPPPTRVGLTVLKAATVVSVRPGPSVRTPRYRFAAAVADTEVWVMGGVDDDNVMRNPWSISSSHYMPWATTTTTAIVIVATATTCRHWFPRCSLPLGNCQTICFSPQT